MDSLSVKVYNKTYVNVPENSDTLSVLVNNYQPDYSIQVWSGLVVLVIFLFLYWFKKPSVYNSYTTHSAFPSGVANVGVNAYVSPEPDIKVKHSVDLSKLGQINIKNEKL